MKNKMYDAMMFIIVILTALALPGCMTPEGSAGPSQTARSMQADEHREQLIQSIAEHEQMQLPEALDRPRVPEGYHETGFLNFAGEISDMGRRDYYVGLTDPEVIGIQLGGWWSEIEVYEGVYDWRVVDSVFELWHSYGKGVVLCIADSYFNTHDTPAWVFDDYRIRRIAEGHLIDFESANPYVDVSGPGVRTTDRSKVIQGIRSVHAPGRGVFLETRPGVLSSGKTYGFQFDFLSHSAGTYRISIEGMVGPNRVSESFTWTAEAGEAGMMSWTAPPAAFRDPRMKIEVVRGDLSIDNLTIHEITESFRGNVGMPNYFDPNYRPHFEKFVQAMAERYRDHPALLGVYVTGIGHWGEPNLTGDEPDPSNRVRQWHAFGYSEEKFISHIEWSAQMFRRHFPDTELILVTGGWGISLCESDQEMLYWSLANIIEELGLVKKFNGIQEAYGLWNPDLEPKSSQRFRMNDDMIIYLETAAQSYRNAFGYEPHWAGKGLTLMNKILIEGASWMNLYTHDMASRNVHKFMPFAAEQMGRELFNSQYILFGYYPEANLEHPLAPVRYYNIFDGIFHNQHITGDALRIFSQAVDYSIEEGEHAIFTAAFDSSHFHELREFYHRNVRMIGSAPTGGETWIELDVNSRKRYGGMFGTTMTVSYLDRGTDTLVIEALSEPGREDFTVVDLISKNDSGRWIERSYYIPEHFSSWQNREPDDQVILRIGDRGDGREWIRAVFLDYAAAEDYRTSPLPGFDDVLSDEAVILEPRQTLVREFSLPEGQTAHRVSIPYWHGGVLTDKSTVRARLFGHGAKGWELLRDKEFFYGKTGDLIDLFGPGTSDIIRYRVEMEHVLGKAGWLLDARGNPALIVSQYDTEVLRRDHSRYEGGPEEVIWVDLPAAGLELAYTGDASPSPVIVEKRIPRSSEWTAVSPALMPQEHPNGTYRVFFEPQVPGQYRIRTSGIYPVSAYPLVLQRARDVKPAVVRETGVPQAVMDFDSLHAEHAVISGVHQLGDAEVLQLDVTEANPRVTGELKVQGGRNQVIHFTLSNPSPAPLVRVYWRAEGQEFSPLRSVYIPVVPNDPTLRWYSYNIGEELRWADPDGNRSMITELAFEVVTSLNAGYCKLGSIWIGEPEELAVWRFMPGRNIEHSLLTHQSPRNRIQDSILTIEGRNAGFVWPRGLDSFWGEPGQSMSVTLRNSSDADTLTVTFEVQDRDEDKKTHSFSSHAVQIPLRPYEDEFLTHIVSLPWDDYDSRRVFEYSFGVNNTAGSVEFKEIILYGKNRIN